MVKCIQFGFFGKKLLLPFGVALVQIIMGIMNSILPEKPKNSILEMVLAGFAEVSLALIPLFTKQSFKTYDKFVVYKLKQRLLHHFILLIIFAVYIIINIITNIQNSKYIQILIIVVYHH